MKISSKQLKMGEQVEKEHHGGPGVAKKIALDHLKEIPDYYDRLEKMESEAPHKFNSKEETDMNKNLIVASIRKNNKKKDVGEEEDEKQEPKAEEAKESSAEEAKEERKEESGGGKDKRGKMIAALIALKKKRK